MTTLIPLSLGQFAKVDDSDVSLISHMMWAAKPARQRSEKYYAQGWCGGRKFYMHRLIIGAAKGQVVDHINGDTLDNRRANLRLSSHRLNSINRGPVLNKHGLIGVYETRGLYQASVMRDKVRKRTKRFKTPVEAAFAYDKLALTVHGPQARINFPCLKRECM